MQEAFAIRLGLGTIPYGDRVTEADAHHQLDLFTDAGGRLVDTARCYGAWAADGHGYQGMVEEILGRWLKDPAHRRKVFLCTKGAHPLPENMTQMRVTPEAIRSDLDRSLSALHTDHIDLYLLHRDNPAQPIEPLLDAMEAAVREGKILHYGCSNWTLPRIKEAQSIARDHGWQGFSANQVQWSLARVNPEAVSDKTLVQMNKEMLDYHKDTGLALMAYTSLAHGYLLRMAAGLPDPEFRHQQYDNPTNEQTLKLIQRMHADPLAVSLRYIVLRSYPSIPLVSFSSEIQLKEAISAVQDSRYDALLTQLP